MGRKKRTQIKAKKEQKRKKRRQRLAKTGKNPDESFYGGIYVNREIR